MAEMVEKVAQAILENLPSPYEIDAEAREAFERCARAAIDAMREASPGMLVKGWTAADDCLDESWDSYSETGSRYLQHDAAIWIWRAMIDAALAEQKAEAA